MVKNDAHLVSNFGWWHEKVGTRPPRPNFLGAVGMRFEMRTNTEIEAIEVLKILTQDPYQKSILKLISWENVNSTQRDSTETRGFTWRIK